MNTITLTIAATPDNLKRLAEAFGDCIDENFPKDAMPARRITSTGPAEKTVESAEIKLPEKPENEAKPTENVAKEPETAAKPEGPAHTLSELRSLASSMIKVPEKRAEIKKILQEFNAPRVPELKQEDWDAFYARLEAIK